MQHVLFELIEHLQIFIVTIFFAKSFSELTHNMSQHSTRVNPQHESVDPKIICRLFSGL